MENFKDYYRVLRVSPTADDATIKAAFRRLAYRYHPDVASSKRAARRFPNIQEAYAVLADPEKRRDYDRVYRDRKPAALELSPSRKRRERDDQAGGRFRRFGIALDVLGLRVGLKVDAGSVGAESEAAKAVSAMKNLDANLIIASAPDPVFVSDLQGNILVADEAVS